MTVDSLQESRTREESGAVPQNCLFCRESEVLKGLCNILPCRREMGQDFCSGNPEQGNRDVREDQLIGEEPPHVWMFSR